MDPNQVKHLEFVKDAINRMAHCSFLLKGWSVTLIVGIFALLAKGDLKTGVVWVVLIPAVAFWFLDAYYLFQEKRFRALYESIIAQGATVQLFSMKIKEPQDSVSAWIKTMTNKTVIVFHGSVFLVVIIISCALGGC